MIIHATTHLFVPCNLECPRAPGCGSPATSRWAVCSAPRTLESLRASQVVRVMLAEDFRGAALELARLGSVL